MADLNVQPKKTSILPWIIAFIILLIVLFFVFRGCNQTDKNMDTPNDDSIVTENNNAAIQNEPAKTLAATEGWEGINYEAPTSAYEEITNKDIEVRSDDKYAIYSLGENILFEFDKSTIRSDAVSHLKQIAESINKRYGSGEVRVYGYTDAIGSKGYNKQLAEERADTVRTWLEQNGNISDSRISVVPVGESRPAATNATSEGREQNRRVEIIVKRS